QLLLEALLCLVVVTGELLLIQSEWICFHTALLNALSMVVPQIRVAKIPFVFTSSSQQAFCVMTRFAMKYVMVEVAAFLAMHQSIQIATMACGAMVKTIVMGMELASIYNKQ